MEIYVDLTLVSLFLNGIVSLYFVRTVTCKIIRWYFYIIIGLVNMMQILYVYQSFYLCFLIYILVMLVTFLRYFRNSYVPYLLVYLMFMYVSQLMIFLFFRGLHFYNGLFYVENSNEVFYLFSYLVVIVAIYFVSLFVDRCFRLNKYKEKVILVVNNKKYITDGYYDTGNLLLYQKTPVVFIGKNRYFTNNSLFDKNVEVSTINGNVIYKCKEALISLGDSGCYHYVYLCLCEENGFNGCDLLLNGYLS